MNRLMKAVFCTAFHFVTKLPDLSVLFGADRRSYLEEYYNNIPDSEQNCRKNGHCLESGFIIFIWFKTLVYFS